VVNIGRETGTGLTVTGIAQYLELDSSYGSLQDAMYGVATNEMSYLSQSLKAVSQHASPAVLILLPICFWKSLRETIVRPDRVETAFRQWAKFLGLSDKWRVWFIALYVITGMADQIGRNPEQ
jgi:cytochrome c biogenesis protein CcdA